MDLALALAHTLRLVREADRAANLAAPGGPNADRTRFVALQRVRREAMRSAREMAQPCTTEGDRHCSARP